VREVVMERPGVVERKMFGGLGWMVGGKMACAVMTAGLAVRIDS
jgi:TfoX/Sxy family transcriptional regulator of competence genes